MKSDPITLAGDYGVSWSSSSECGIGIYLVGVDDGSRDLIVNEGWADGSEHTTNAYGLQAGRYYLDGTTECPTWHVAFTPR